MRATEAGIQDASRKRREVSQTPGAWAGAVITTDGKQVGITISQDRWEKTKRILEWIRDAIESDPDAIPFKVLESHRGFLVYVTRTFPASVPYLMGIHLTLDSWREGRDEDGWKIRAEVEKYDEEAESPVVMEGAPLTVCACSRLEADVYALRELFTGDTPCVRKARPDASVVALYGFGDASGYGFGSTLLKDGRILYRCGEWSEEMASESSNFREFSNLIRQVEEHTASGDLRNCELFLFTDNSTSEAAFYKGTSKSKKLFDLVLRLRKLQMRSGITLHVIHVAGKRMMAQGTDGVSRGDLLTGVFAGNSLLDYVPLHSTALERSVNLLPWVRGWYPNPELNVMTPEDWFDGSGNQSNMKHCLWAPAPASASVAIEQLCAMTLKRTDETHIIIIPRLLTSMWRKRLAKVADVVVTLPLDGPYWGLSQHEPLLLAICFPLIRSSPWKLGGTPLLERFEGSVRSMPAAGEGGLGAILHELFLQAWTLDAMPKRVVRSLLS
jgi:hypothetical protein